MEAQRVEPDSHPGRETARAPLTLDRIVSAAIELIESEGPDLPIVATAWSGGALVFYSRRFDFAWPVAQLIPLDFSTDPVLAWAAETQPGPTWVVTAHRLEQSRVAVEAISEFAPVIRQHETDTAGVYLVNFDRAFAERYRAANPG